jgi:O-antigen/teichoic acid export membrane protein
MNKENDAELHRIIRNGGSLIVARVFSKVATTLLIIYVARYIGDQLFGVFSSLLAFIALFSLLIEFGLTVPLIRLIARGGSDAGVALGRVIAVKIPLSILALVSLLLCSLLFDIPFFLALVFGISMALEMQSLAVVRSFEGFEQMKYVSLLTMLERFSLCLFGFLALTCGYGLTGLGIAYVLSNLITLVSGLLLFSKRFSRVRVHIDLLKARSLLREAAPFLIGSVFSVLYNKVDIFFLTAYRSNSEVGWYNAAFRVIEAQTFLPIAVVGAVFPVLTRYSQTSYERFESLSKRTILLLSLLGFVAAAITFVAASPVILILFGSSYSNAVQTLQMSSLVIPFYYANSVLGNSLIATGKENLSAVTLGIGSVVSIALCTILVPGHGPKGAAITRVTIEALSFILQLLFLSRVFRERRLLVPQTASLTAVKGSEL